MSDIQNYHQPLVSVIMANYNTPIEYLKEAIESVLNQTYSNLELIIVDDCSTNDSVRYIESINDKRIVLKKNDTNKGPAYTRNRAFDIAHGKYIAIMDSDDISDIFRLQKQVDYMENNPNTIVCASWANVFGDGVKTPWMFNPSFPKNEIFKISLLFGNTFIVNSTVMMDRDTIEKHNVRFIEEYTASQDYKMWVDCVRYGEFAMITEPLVRRRVRQKSITTSSGGLQEFYRWRIIEEQLDKLHYTLSEEKKKYYNCIYSPRKLYDLRTKEIIKELISANQIYRVYKQRSFKKYLWERWAVISTYGFKNEKGVKKKFQVLLNMPINRFHYIIKTVSSLLFEKTRDNNNRKKQ